MSFISYVTVRDRETYSVDECFDCEQVTIDTYLDPNGVSVLLGIAIKDYSLVFPIVDKSSDCTIVKFGYDEDLGDCSVEVLPCANPIHVYRNSLGNVVRIIAFDGHHSIRKYMPAPSASF